MPQINWDDVDIANVVDPNGDLLRQFFGELRQNANDQQNGSAIIDLSASGNAAVGDGDDANDGMDSDDSLVMSGMPTNVGNDKEEAE